MRLARRQWLSAPVVDVAAMLPVLSVRWIILIYHESKEHLAFDCTLAGIISRQYRPSKGRADREFDSGWPEDLLISPL